MRPFLLVVVGTTAILARLGEPPASPPASREQRLHYTPQDRETGRYQYVPVQVPAGATRLRIAYAYDAAGGANVVDLGLFEPGPLDLGTPAFRGWSGGARNEITVGTSAATPGYWPGPLPAGEWHVMLGLYKVAPQGVDVRLTVEASSAPDPSPVPALAPRPLGALKTGPAWYSGGLHLHTVHSDGRETTAEVCQRAHEAGLDFVAITDHNNTTHQLDLVDEPGLLRIVGEEVTTPGGHASVWGIGGWRDYVDFRLLPGDERIKDLVRAVTARGALFAINHPRSPCLGCGWEHLVPDGIAALEITDHSVPAMLAAIAWWDSFLAHGRRITAVGSSDWHSPDHPIAMASVRVWAGELSEAAILEGIRAGRVVVMEDGVTPPPVLVAHAGPTEARVGDTLAVEPGRQVVVEVTVPATLARGHVDLVWDGKVVGSESAAGGTSVRFERTVTQDGYARAQVYAAEPIPVAITNPVYFKVRAR
jgi:PHP domain-containing protein